MKYRIDKSDVDEAAKVQPAFSSQCKVNISLECILLVTLDARIVSCVTKCTLSVVHPSVPQ